MTQASQLDVLTSVIYQFEYHWKEQIRPRLEGLTDAEYLYDPSADRSAWTVHPADERRTEMQAGARDTVVDFAFPEPDPAPFTTIGWRLAHVIVGVLAVRSHAHLGGPEASYQSWDYSPTAEGALEQLDAEVARWFDGIRKFDDARLAQPCGPDEGPWGELPMLDLLLHINRELIHHLAEIALLRDLYAHTR
ncbi:DinB family protein [Kocuria coralli]|uniref:DinB family protein n=1 Tax=Kocuria coralli TaxID=1461025 RepID=A0A5J5KYE8_9MICC|nr:DinB family protein [Kocuria coralli]KAA9393915.1 DinB family protein [Kocuria coralli]